MCSHILFLFGAAQYLEISASVWAGLTACSLSIPEVESTGQRIGSRNPLKPTSADFYSHIAILSSNIALDL